jgi:hypothetical protein
MGRVCRLLSAVAIALTLFGCATTNPAVPEGTRIYFEGVSYVGEEGIALGRTLAPLVEAEIRKLVDGAGVVTFVTQADRASADYDLVIRIADAQLRLDLHTRYRLAEPEPREESFSHSSSILVEGESRLTPIAPNGKVLVREFAEYDPDTEGWVWGSGGNGSSEPALSPARLKRLGHELLKLHATWVAQYVLFDLGFVTSESVLKFHRSSNSPLIE